VSAKISINTKFRYESNAMWLIVVIYGIYSIIVILFFVTFIIPKIKPQVLINDLWL